jgi:hypothetical protein
LVVSDSMLNKAGRTRSFFCGPQGRFTVSARLDELPPSAAAFSGLRRGDLVRLEGLAERESGGMAVEGGSSVRIL